MAFVTRPQLLRACRCLRVLQLDGTCKTNKQKYVLVYVCAEDGNNKTVVILTAFVKSESNKAFTFLTQTCLPFIYGRFLRRVSVMLSDGASAITSAIDSGINSALYGNGKTIRLRCYFHRVSQYFIANYKGRHHLLTHSMHAQYLLFTSTLIC